MSLIDTACVGRVSSVQLAALGPNTAIFNFAFQLFAFLGVGTTNIIAINSLRAPGLSSAELAARREAAERTLCNSLQLAAAIGCLVAAVLLTCGRTFLAGMGVAPELLTPAWEYLSIRALAAPAVLIMSASQGACLGQQDSWTPFNVLLAAGLLNTVGDIYLISARGMGVAGAALATAAAQYLGAAYFLWHLWHKGRRPGGLRLRWTGLPQPSQMRDFLLVAATLFTRTIFGLAAYFSMTTAATRLGTLATATHQVAMQTFWFLSCFPEPLSLAAQSLLARDRGNPERAAHWAWLLLRSGAALGLLLAAAVGLVFTRAASWFSADLAVQLAVARLAPVAMSAIAVCSVMMMFDGISVGNGSFAHLPPSNVAGLGVTLAVLHVGQQRGLGLAAVWCALVAFYATRLSGHVLRYGAFGASVFRDSKRGTRAGGTGKH
ncbi:hypothetical protein ABPG75_010614 [Micractinium tetrahymenae]